jgi:carbon-monoxide dehydrogenase medium subunit
VNPVEFSAPSTLAEATDLLREEGAVALGGGTVVVALMKERLLSPRRLVWLGRIAGLRRIQVTAAGSLWIGGGTILLEITRSPAVQGRWPVLARTAGEVGNVRVRSVATLGGHLAHADPSQDLPPVLLALGATAHLRSAAGRRSVPLEGFFRGFLETVLEPGEIVEAVEVPPLSPGTRASYLRFTPGSREDFPTVGVAASVQVDARGVVSSARVALGGVAPTPLLLADAARILTGQRPRPGLLEEAAAAAWRAADPWDDRRGTARYKRAMARVWTRRCLEELLR